MMSPAELLSHQTQAARLCGDTVTILRAGQTRDAGGGTTTTYTVAGTVPGDAIPTKTPVERVIEGRLVVVQGWHIRTRALPGDLAPAPQDQVQVGGRTFEVIGLPVRISRVITRRVRAVEIA